MENQREHIVQVAVEKMRQVGIRSVSIDDVCRTIGMSKKTFYIYFATKDDLVEAALKLEEAQMVQFINDKLEQKTILEQLMNFQKVVHQTHDVRRLPPLIYDLQKYYPLLYQQHCERRKKNAHMFLVKALQKGKDEGLFRTDLDVEKTSRIIVELHEGIMNMPAHTREDKKTMEYVKYASDILMRGILSERGLQVVQEYTKKKN